jgi:hypothetical protein
MTNLQPEPSGLMQDRFGRWVAARLSAGTAELPYETTERLRAARVQALAARKTVSLNTVPALFRSGSAATLAFGQGPSLWRRIAAAVPLVVLATGLVVINVVQNDRRATEVAEVDAALLTDDLPPQAYADPGFIQFLKTGVE